MSNENNYIESDLDLDLNLDLDLDLDVSDVDEFAEDTTSADKANLADATDYFEKISPLFDEGAETEIDLAGEDLSLDDDYTSEDNSEMVLDAVEANLRYKEAELNFYTSENSMQASDQVNRLYTSLIKSGTHLDKVVISALLRSVINYDNTSVFGNASSQTYEIIIYEILKGIVLRLKDSQEVDEGIAISYITTFDDVKVRYQALSDKTSIDDMKELMHQVTRLNNIILSQESLKSVYMSIKSAVPNIQSLRKFIVTDGNNQTKQSREIAEHISELEDDVAMLSMITETVDPEDVDEDTVINQPIGAIFKSIQSPVTDENGNIGFKYVCGHCGKEHFTQRSPFRANHIPRAKYEASKGYNYDVIDYASAMLLVFNPIQCPSCHAVNMFSKNFIMKSKLAAWHLASSLLISDGRKSFTNVNLIFLADALQGSLAPNDTKLLPPNIKVVKPYEKENPLDNPDTKNESLDSFIQMIHAADGLKVISSQVYERNVQYLRFLYKIKPIASLAVDTYSATYSVLRSNMALHNALSECAKKERELAEERFLLEVLEKLTKYLGAPMYTDSIVNVSYIESVMQVYYANLGEEYNLNLPANDLDTTRDILINTITELRQMNESEQATNDEYINQIIQSYKDTYKVTPIGRIPSADAEKDPLARSSILGRVWDAFKGQYPEMLYQTVFPIVVSQVESKLFVGGAIKLGQDKTHGKSLLEFAKALNARHKIKLALPADTLDKSVEIILRTILQIEDPNVFADITHVPLQILSKDLTTDYLYNTTLETYMLHRYVDLFGDSLTYANFLSGETLQEATQKFIDSYQASNETSVLPSEVEAQTLDAAYLFINCIPTSAPELLAQKEKLESQIREEAEAESKRFKELGI